MAILIRRSEALRRINQLEEQAAERGDRNGGVWIVRCFNAIMSCAIEDKIYCNQCGRRIRPDDSGGEEDK